MGLFVIKKKKDLHTFYLKTDKGQVILVGANYNSVKDCKNAISFIKKKVLEGVSVFQVKQRMNSAFYCVLKGRNGRIVAMSEDFYTKAAVANNIYSIRENGHSEIQIRT